MYGSNLFDFQDGLYYFENDIKIEERMVAKDKDGKYTFYPDKEEEYTFKKLYLIKKQYDYIMYLEDKEEAEKIIEYMKNYSKSHKYIHIKNNEIIPE